LTAGGSYKATTHTVTATAAGASQVVITLAS
jgi:hypothetical protein